MTARSNSTRGNLDQPARSQHRLDARDRRAIRRYVLRLNVQRAWDSLSWWEHLLVAGVLWTFFWAAVIHVSYPYLLRAVVA